MSVVSMKQLLESGVHFGHQTRRWNPKMEKYIFGERNGIYIVDLKKTVRMIKEACRHVRDTVADGKSVLFVGTKKQAQETIIEEAKRCGMYYVSTRWLGGTLTNFKTIQSSIQRLKDIDQMEADGSILKRGKKEVLELRKERERLMKYLSGIRDMDGLPGAMFVADTRKDKIAVAEANKLKIPVIAIVDTNCDPDPINFVIPGNDDAIRAVRLITSRVADAVIEGRKVRAERELGIAEGDSSVLETAESETVEEADVEAEELEEEEEILDEEIDDEEEEED